jgi:hypothetical protein
MQSLNARTSGLPACPIFLFRILKLTARRWPSLRPTSKARALASGDTYRDEIMTQLVAARAVLVLWTPNAIKSDFVRAEAGRAKADGKLIPVKTADVEYRDIPLPFGEMHTENLGNLALIRAVVLAQLAKPAVQRSNLWLASATLRYQALTWFGIIGGAVTLFSNLNGVLNLADWARWLTSHWHELTTGFWTWAFGWVHRTLGRCHSGGW